VTRSSIDLAGIFPPLPTLFSADGDLDLDAMTRHLDHLRGFDLRGAVVLGSNGEAVHLDAGERARLIEHVRMRIPGGRWMIVGTGRQSTRDTIAASRQAAALGADAVLVLPPHYYRGRMTRDALVAHFHAVANASSVPVVLYNMPACTGIDMDVATVLAAAEHDNIIGLKESGGDVTKLGALHQALGDRFHLLAGSAGFLLPALSVGAVGGVLALANIAPDRCLEILTRVDAGDWSCARAIQCRIVDANTAVTRRWGVAGLKAAMNLLGLPGGAPRRPLLPLTGIEIEELQRILVDAGILGSTS